MKISGNTILITGGASGIGFGMAAAFVNAGNKVLICGRRQAKLEEARKILPQLHVRQCDVSQKEGCISLYDWIRNQHPDLNILINNAGISRFIDFRKGAPALFRDDGEIATNLAAPVYLSACFIPLLLGKREAAIVNISSGLGFIPMASAPLYCATKAGIHIFSLSLRHQLKDTSIRVFEIMPPIVDTDLGKDSMDSPPRTFKGISPSEFAIEALKALENDEYETASGEARDLMEGSRRNFDEVFQMLNKGFDQ